MYSRRPFFLRRIDSTDPGKRLSQQTHKRGKMNFMVCVHKKSIFRLHLLPAYSSFFRVILPNHELPRYGFVLQLSVSEVLGLIHPSPVKFKTEVKIHQTVFRPHRAQEIWKRATITDQFGFFCQWKSLSWCHCCRIAALRKLKKMADGEDEQQAVEVGQKLSEIQKCALYKELEGFRSLWDTSYVS